jgi:serine/threonine protein kinase
MSLTDSFVLPPGTTFQPARELPEQFRREIGMQDDDYALSRANSRTHSKVIDADAAMLLREFEKSSTIARAVARFSQGKSVNAEQLLEDALPMLRSMIESGLLVPSESGEASRDGPMLSVAENVNDWSVLRCVQSMEDTEVYQVRSPNGQFGAFKIGRSNLEVVSRGIDREARILSELDSTVSPRPLKCGEWKSLPYVLMDWFPGAEAHSVYAELRQSNDRESRTALLQVTGSILRAYAHLHEQGVIHGDVHPRNVLIDLRGNVRIVDFGLARKIVPSGQDDSFSRGGISFFFEPEFAQAASKSQRPPLSTVTGEGYALGALFYLLITGSHYLDFSLEKRTMLQQIAEDSMVPFTQRRIEAWPDVEKLLKRALSKRPSDRFASIAEFARAWDAAEVPAHRTPSPSAVDSKLPVIRAEFVAASAIQGPLLGDAPMAPPSTSLAYGSAGLAYALYRISCASDDSELFAIADVWSNKSAREIGSADAFYSDALEITAQRVGALSLHHGPAGVYAVQALIALARGDLASQYSAVQAFISTCRQPCDVLDLTLGSAGALLGCALLLDTFGGRPQPDRIDSLRAEITSLGNALLQRIWQVIAGYAPIGESSDLAILGIAHGWGGLLYAAICWCVVANEPIPETLHRRLQELAACAEPMSRGLQWPIDAGKHERSYPPGWCSGAAGYVFLWTLAYRATGDMKYLELAEGAAWHAWEMLIPNVSLCCGAAGQIYALLNFHRHSGDAAWLKRARKAAHDAAITSTNQPDSKRVDSLEWRPASLYRGDAGLAILAADLDRPQQARMPMFEPES